MGVSFAARYSGGEKCSIVSSNFGNDACARAGSGPLSSDFSQESSIGVDKAYLLLAHPYAYQGQWLVRRFL